MRVAPSGRFVTAGVLLAAGAGRRYGMPKALVKHGDQLLVEHGAATLRAAGCEPVLVVLGAAADEVRARADLTGVTVVVNRDWATGMGSSLRCALATLAGATVDAAVVLLVDTPGVTADAVERVARAGTKKSGGSKALVTATYGGRRGHPVVLGRSHWPGASDLARGDVGARPYLIEHVDQLVEVPCDDISDGTDLDFPPDHHA